MFKFFGKLKEFLGALAADPRIPKRDKALLTALCALLASPLDLIPDFIPIFGLADDLIVAVIVLDYVFNVAPEAVILEHFPWDARRYRALRRWTRFASWLVPNFLRRRIWKQVKKLEQE